MRFSARISFALARLTLGLAVTGFLVITERIFTVMSLTVRRSRLVSIPTSLPLERMGKPLTLLRARSSKAADTGSSASRVTGLVTIPDCQRLTLRTSSAWSSTLMFLWIMPRPPCRAREIAKGAVVTVSIAALIIGMLSLILGASWVLTSVWDGKTEDSAGTSRTSSNVRASGKSFIKYLFCVVNIAKNAKRGNPLQRKHPLNIVHPLRHREGEL